MTKNMILACLVPFGLAGCSQNHDVVPQPILIVRQVDDGFFAGQVTTVHSTGEFDVYDQDGQELHSGKLDLKFFNQLNDAIRRRDQGTWDKTAEIPTYNLNYSNYKIIHQDEVVRLLRLVYGEEFLEEPIRANN